MEDKVPLVLYRGYGSFSISKKCRDYLIENNVEIKDDTFGESYRDGYFLLSEFSLDDFKDNKVLIEYISKGLGKETDPELKIVYISKEYYDNECYHIDEYDGFESIILEKEKLIEIKKNNNIKEILYLDISDSEKISKLKLYFD